MSEILIRNAIKRETGYLYFIDGSGNLCRAKLNRAGGTKKENRKRKKQSKK